MKHIPVYSDTTLIDEAHRLAQASEPFAWVTIINQEGSSARHLGSSMLVTREGRVIGTIGGAIAELQLIEQAMQAIKEKKPRTVKMPLPVCAGVITCFINVFKAQETLILVGAGHVAQPIAKLAKMLGFQVTVIDDRADYGTKERFPEADRIIVDDWDKALKELQIDQDTYVVILTYAGESDELALRTLIGSKAAYIGMISSESKAKGILSKLKRDGIPDELLRKVVTPIGLDIGAETPAEIAVSTMAEIVMRRKRRTGKPLSIAEREITRSP
ncbi:MAG: XdhC/CoxI family protein [Candidatus Bathyarchaeia archaeon]